MENIEKMSDDVEDVNNQLEGFKLDSEVSSEQLAEQYETLFDGMADGGCNDLKSSMEQSATGNTEIKDIEFHSDKVCGVYLYEKDNNKKINLWFKASFADNKMYKYIINSYGEGLSLEIVAGVTEEFKEFKY